MAIPVLANGQGGVNCGLCHTAVPHLNSYGRYVLMTNFSIGLNKRLQMDQTRRLPLALELTANASRPPDPALPAVHAALVQFLSAGFIGPDVSYFASVPVVTGGFPAASIDQVWFAYNGLARANGSLQIGKFATPVFAPWTSQSLSLTGNGLTSLQVGLNDATLADNRWGASYTHFIHLGLMANASYLTDTGKGPEWTASLQYLSPESRWSGGAGAVGGSYRLPSGTRDRYTRGAALVSYAGSRYDITAMGLAGHDDNPSDGASGPATSGGVSFEAIYAPLPWAHMDIRYEQLSDGLGSSSLHYVAAAAFSLRPNLVLTLENVAGADKKPVQNYQLLWSGPWLRDRIASHGAPVDDSAAIANGRALYFTGVDRDGVRIGTADTARVYQSCAVCHGTDGSGGVRLADGAVSAQLGSAAHMLDQMDSMASMDSMKKNTPWTIELFERAIAQGVDQNGETLSPVMPRWKMSARDLRDIALYISTQIREPAK